MVQPHGLQPQRIVHAGLGQQPRTVHRMALDLLARVLANACGGLQRQAVLQAAHGHVHRQRCLFHGLDEFGIPAQCASHGTGNEHAAQRLVAAVVVGVSRSLVDEVEQGFIQALLRQALHVCVHVQHPFQPGAVRLRLRQCSIEQLHQVVPLRARLCTVARHRGPAGRGLGDARERRVAPHQIIRGLHHPAAPGLHAARLREDRAAHAQPRTQGRVEQRLVGWQQQSTVGIEEIEGQLLLRLDMLGRHGNKFHEYNGCELLARLRHRHAVWRSMTFPDNGQP